MDYKCYEQIGIVENSVMKVIHGVGVAQKSDHTDGKCRIVGILQLNKSTIALGLRPETVHTSGLRGSILELKAFAGH